jgi:hypothetical protein
MGAPVLFNPLGRRRWARDMQPLAKGSDVVETATKDRKNHLPNAASEQAARD